MTNTYWKITIYHHLSHLWKQQKYGKIPYNSTTSIWANIYKQKVKWQFHLSVKLNSPKYNWTTGDFMTLLVSKITSIISSSGMLFLMKGKWSQVLVWRLISVGMLWDRSLTSTFLILMTIWKWEDSSNLKFLYLLFQTSNFLRSLIFTITQLLDKRESLHFYTPKQDFHCWTWLTRKVELEARKHNFMAWGQ